MAERSTSGQGCSVGPAAAASGVGHALDQGAFLLLLIVVAMRPLLSETYASSLHAIAGAVGSAGALTPATTAGFGVAVWLAAVGAVTAARLLGRRWRWSGAEIGAVLMLGAAVISSASASDRRLAANASADWLTAIVLMFVAANLCRSRRRVALLLAVLAASGAASAAKCIMQVADEYPATRQWYETTKADFWAKQGVALDDPQVDLFERRMAAGEASGFFAHSNAQGSWLGLAGFAALALSAAPVRRRPAQWIPLAVAAALFAAIFTTGSRGAIAATAGGVVLWLLLRATVRFIRRHWCIALLGAWLLVAAAAAAVLMIGRARGSLPGASLAFRWEYWQVTRRIIAEHPWTGVGALNFDRAYLAVKPIEYPEEIKDPHNFILAVAAQWGLPGAIGLVLAAFGASVVAAWTWGRQGGAAEHGPPLAGHSALPGNRRLGGAAEHGPPPAGRSASGRTLGFWVAAVIAGFLLLRVWMLRGLWMEDATGAAYVFLDLGVYGLVWAMCFAGMAWIVSRDDEQPAGHHTLACVCGVAAFLLHNTIDFSLFVPGSLTGFAAMAGLLLAGQDADGAAIHPLRPRRLLPAVLPLTGLICFCWLVAIPVNRSSHDLQRAREAAERVTEDDSSYATALAAYRRAAQVDRHDPTPLRELAELPLHMQHPRLDHLNDAVRAIHEAIGRDPDDIALYRLRSQLLQTRFLAAGSGSDLYVAIGAARKAVALYPQSPDERLRLGSLLAQAARHLDSPDLAAQARTHLQSALDLDASRPGLTEARRWSPVRRQQVMDQLAALPPVSATQAVSASAPASSPWTP